MLYESNQRGHTVYFLEPHDVYIRSNLVVARLRKIIDDFGGAMVVKPLQRFGGEGVIKVSAHDRVNLNSLLRSGL